MPIHHGDGWLAQTLDSVAAQDCTGIEFILLDSSDNEACASIVACFEDRLDIHYERNESRTSWPAKTNVAVERATAEHVVMLHQDDLWLPSRTRLMREAIEAFPEAVMLLNPSFIVDEHERRLGLWRCPLRSETLLQTSEVAERLLVQNFVAIPAPVIRKAAWIDSGGMDSDLWYTADWDLYLKLLGTGAVVYRTTPSTAFRVHGSSLTVSGSRDRPEFEGQMNAVIDRHLNLAPVNKRARIRRRAKASIAVNCELAGAAAGSASALLRALVSVLLLGPFGGVRYLRDSRLLERALPRLRARLAGSF